MAQAHRQPTGAASAGPLKASEVVDTADTSPRAPAPNTSGKRIRAIPYSGGTTVKVSELDFKQHKINHPTVVFDFRRDHFTLPVGKNGISEEAADFLVKHEPSRFEYINA